MQIKYVTEMSAARNPRAHVCTVVACPDVSCRALSATLHNDANTPVNEPTPVSHMRGKRTPTTHSNVSNNNFVKIIFLEAQKIQLLEFNISRRKIRTLSRNAKN